MKQKIINFLNAILAPRVTVYKCETQTEMNKIFPHKEFEKVFKQMDKTFEEMDKLFKKL